MKHEILEAFIQRIWYLMSVVENNEQGIERSQQMAEYSTQLRLQSWADVYYLAWVEV